jgi:hypothetical protein
VISSMMTGKGCSTLLPSSQNCTFRKIRDLSYDGLQAPRPVLRMQISASKPQGTQWASRCGLWYLWGKLGGRYIIDAWFSQNIAQVDGNRIIIVPNQCNLSIKRSVYLEYTLGQDLCEFHSTCMCTWSVLYVWLIMKKSMKTRVKGWLLQVFYEDKNQCKHKPITQALSYTCIQRGCMPCLFKNDDFRRFPPHQLRRPHFRVFDMEVPTRGVGTYYTISKLCPIDTIDVWMDIINYLGWWRGLRSLPTVMREGTKNTWKRDFEVHGTGQSNMLEISPSQQNLTSPQWSYNGCLWQLIATKKGRGTVLRHVACVHMERGKNGYKSGQHGHKTYKYLCRIVGWDAYDHINKAQLQFLSLCGLWDAWGAISLPL